MNAAAVRAPTRDGEGGHEHSEEVARGADRHEGGDPAGEAQCRDEGAADGDARGRTRLAGGVERRRRGPA